MTQGQLGNGTVSNSSVAQTVAGGGGGISATAITNGLADTCALRASASASCWGRNSVGQLGDGTRDDRPFPTAVTNLTSVVAIVAGTLHTCALLADGTARCWGENSHGSVGDGTNSPNSGQPLPTAVTGLTNALAIAAGADHTCALIADGTARCWGSNRSGQLGDGTTGNGTSNSDRLLPTAVTGLTNAVAIAAGADHTCALIADGTARCWGSNRSGQLGDGTTGNGSRNSDRPLPTAVTGLTNAVAIVAGSDHTCALLADGTARCWGNNPSGQLGDGTNNERLVPNTVVGLTNAVAIAAGNNYTCALIVVGTARCWGDNLFGQLGNHNSTEPLPVTVNGLTNTFAIAAGEAHTCAIKATGAVFCWGQNGEGELGIGPSGVILVPTAVPSFTLNIDPRVELQTRGRFATVTILANCPEGQWLQVQVKLTQDSATAHGFDMSPCEAGLERYPLTVIDLGRNSLHTGPAEVEADAVIWNHLRVADRQEWTRKVDIVDEQ